jgi:hypothetical protein
MLNPDQAAQVIETARRHLLTPFGLRTLSLSDPRYRGRYEGGPRKRDGAYHQGTVWPWLMGPFLKAYIGVNGRAEASRKEAAQWLTELRLKPSPKDNARIVRSTHVAIKLSGNINPNSEEVLWRARSTTRRVPLGSRPKR